MTTFVGKFLPRTDSAANLADQNPVLGLGERARESDTGREKQGDGVTAYNSLPYEYGHGRTVAAADVTFTAAGTISSGNVQDALVEVATDAAGGVQSVNGETGAVTLSAADVAADVAGSASAVQANLDNHEGLEGLTAHVPSGGADGQVLTKGAGTSVAWEDPAGGGGAVDSVNGEVGVVVLGAADIPFSPTGTVAATTVQAAIAEVAAEAGGVTALDGGSPTDPGADVIDGGSP